MSDSPRLAELRRQRALIQGHLAWLDAEIAAAEKPNGAPQERTSTTPPAMLPEATPIAISGAANVRTEAAGALAEGADTHAEQILGEYRKPATDLQRDVRTGCFLYFAAAIVLFFAIVAGLYFALRH